MRFTLVVLAWIAVLTAPAPLLARDSWDGVDRIVAIGDLHGDFAQYRAVMKMAGLLDDDAKWTGGRTHLVQLGDIPDRGPDSLAIIRDLRSLERAAKRAGGYVHLLIGNHEAMNVTGDLRYVHPGEYQALITSRSQQNQDAYFAAVVNSLREAQPDLEVTGAFRDEFRTRFPLGYVEHRRLWEGDGELARYVRGNNAVIRINDVLFVHGGLDPHRDWLPLDQINRTIRRELDTRPLPTPSLVEDENGPLWYRGIATNPEATEREPLARMLAHYGAAHIVVGHTPTRGFINPRFDRLAIMADVGLSSHYGAALAALLIEDGKFFALHRGVRVPLPDDAGLADYLRALRPLEPDPGAIDRIVQLIVNPPAAGDAAGTPAGGAGSADDGATAPPAADGAPSP